MGEIQQMIYDQGEPRGLVKGDVKMINRMLKMNVPVEEIKKGLNEDFSPEIVKEALSQVNLVA